MHLGRHFYYSGHRLVEIRDGASGGGQVLKHHVWGLTYIDELAQIGLNADPAVDSSIDTFYYPLYDANYNITALVDGAGTLVERYEYTPYGQRKVFTTPGSEDAAAHAPLFHSKRHTIGSATMAWGLNDVGHQGLVHDEEVSSDALDNRARYLKGGRFMQRDPLDYVDSSNLFQYQRGLPTGSSDAFGTQARRRAGMSGEIDPWIKIEISPNQLEGLWSWTFPHDGYQRTRVAWTHFEPEFSCATVSYGSSCWFVECTIGFGWSIHLNAERARTDLVTTARRRGAYGHETRHVGSAATQVWFQGEIINKQIKDDLPPLGWDSEQEAQTYIDKTLNGILGRTRFQKIFEREYRHSNPRSPGTFDFLDPIGPFHDAPANN